MHFCIDPDKKASSITPTNRVTKAVLHLRRTALKLDPEVENSSLGVSFERTSLLSGRVTSVADEGWSRAPGEHPWPGFYGIIRVRAPAQFTLGSHQFNGASHDLNLTSCGWGSNVRAPTRESDGTTITLRKMSTFCQYPWRCGHLRIRRM